MSLGDFLRKVGDMLDGDQNEQQQQPRGRVRPASQDPYGDPADQGNAGEILPASQDPYGDPADTGDATEILPASQDPYGDPADQEEMPAGVRPASEDPYGDPADARPRRRRGLF